ncbi:hypothetical protein ACMU_06745 [Actibacterium mucosum KCTC 23349]|uniref:HTH merR-type domain-containing protein n=1 Tax=Actibacterium mucosum KCTC 23349 TaxID=1454373 RepID=A0A037ZJL8_9RHOB|nr:MerR family transcriptional regulator [Actibacterium mucosum]KAJ56635.1 hypothetical protein ACMU_06745 [Actibacterium mucosum KCTC 23349]
MRKSPDAFRTISEVAEWLDTPAHVLRFWESRFTQVKPVKRAGGRRYYRPNDMLLLGGLKKLLHEDGMTIRGVQKYLREHGVKEVMGLSHPLDEDEVLDGTVTAENDDDVTTEAPEAPMAENVEDPVEADNVVPLHGDPDAPELDFGPPPTKPAAEAPPAPEEEPEVAPEPVAATPMAEDADAEPVPEPEPAEAAAPAALGDDLPADDPADDDAATEALPLLTALRRVQPGSVDAAPFAEAQARLIEIRTRFDPNA